MSSENGLIFQLPLEAREEMLRLRKLIGRGELALRLLIRETSGDLTHEQEEEKVGQLLGRAATLQA
jgi:hypothetical protein